MLLRLSKPDFDILSKVRKDVASKLIAGARLIDGGIDVVVVHRDADGAGRSARENEIIEAIASSGINCSAIPVIPVRMTEAWLLLDEKEIRRVAGNPNGTGRIPLPKMHEVERIADPKELLKECLTQAASERGRRRQRATNRFSQHRRQLLERLDINGPVAQLESWKFLIKNVEAVISASF
ncbi:MAG TPA: hypothetical protein VFV66_16075 [Nonomuraea sp.]|nr:hypothetical protein [Nonomuraea sp.]